MDPIERVRTVLGRAAARTAARVAAPRRTSREDLVSWARAHLGGRQLIVVSNREPYAHEPGPDGPRVVRQAGGMSVALDAVAQALGGVWVAHGAGGADRLVTDARDHFACPPHRPRYTLRRVWLERDEHRRYYSGLANGALWPLCHIVYVRPSFHAADWASYKEVNQRFAEAVLDEIGDKPALVFLQDYHLALAAQYLRAARPDLCLVLFWHIPWPNAEVFRILPWRRELLAGLLANDLVGFHTRTHALNFLDAVAAGLEARVDTHALAVERAGRRTWVGHFPIGVPADEIGALAEGPAAAAGERRLREELQLDGCRLVLGVDRLDYTKGIPERLEALECLFERHPEWVGKLAFVQIGVPTRVELAPYRAVRARMHHVARRINQRFPRSGAPTVHLIERNLDFHELLPYYRAADVCAVTALHDGMNLVAKEYVAASPDLEGALVLSPFTGAARELDRAYLASPYDREAMAEAYQAALSAPAEERRERMAALRETVLRRNIFDWAMDVLDAALGADLHAPAGEADSTAGA